jgi:hypothetical protein
LPDCPSPECKNSILIGATGGDASLDVTVDVASNDVVSNDVVTSDASDAATD